MHGERVYSESRVDVVAPNMFAGSILDLEPDTEYEARFVIADPDGVRGERRAHSRRAHARRADAPARRAHVSCLSARLHGTQDSSPRSKGSCAPTTSGAPARTGRRRAGRACGPATRSSCTRASIKYNRYEYTNDAAVNRTTPLDGTYYLTADGTAERPIAIVAAGDGDVIFDGNGNYALFDVRAADYTYFEGITFRNAEVAILAGTQFIAGSKGLTVKRSRFERVGAGVFTNWSGSSGFYIADSVFIGRNDPNHLIGWAGDMWIKFRGVDGQIFPPAMASYVAVKLYGPGHVVAHNYIADFHDGINVETYGNPDGSVASGPGIEDGPKYPPREYWDRRPVAIDFYGNYITNSHDNPIEADGSMHNIRVLRNLFINHASHAFCNQPTLGGPVYWIRNIAYHLPAGSTRLTNGAAGVLFYNNTILSETVAAGTSNTHWRNNLMLGENAAPAIFNVTTFTQYTSSDYNGFRPNPNVPASFRWSAPRARSGRGLQQLRPHGRARSARVRNARAVRRRDRPGPEQRARRLRRVRRRAAARRAGRRHGAEALRRTRSRLPSQGRARPPSTAAPSSPPSRTDSPAVRRTWARSSSARRCRSTARGPERLSPFVGARAAQDVAHGVIAFVACVLEHRLRRPA